MPSDATQQAGESLVWGVMVEEWDLESWYFVWGWTLPKLFSLDSRSRIFVLIHCLTKEEMSGVNEQQFNIQEGKINCLASSNALEESKDTLM